MRRSFGARASTSWLQIPLGILVAALTFGCIGTDLVEESALVDPEIRVTQRSVALLRGDGAQLEAEYYDGFGNYDATANLVWTSEDPSIASVSASGRTVGVAAGQTYVMVAFEEAVGAPILVTVVADANSAAVVTVLPDTLTLEAGGSSTLSVTAKNIDGVTISPTSISWMSSDDAVASVNSGGEVVAMGPGVAELVAVVDNIASSPARVVVRGRTQRGTFTRRPGTSYNVSGGVELIELPQGRLRVQFLSDFLTSDGPDIDVYLSKTNQVTGASISLGDMVSTTGEQSYTVPSSVEFGEYNWVIIHCVAFNVTFGYASLL